MNTHKKMINRTAVALVALLAGLLCSNASATDPPPCLPCWSNWPACDVWDCSAGQDCCDWRGTCRECINTTCVSYCNEYQCEICDWGACISRCTHLQCCWLSVCHQYCVTTELCSYTLPNYGGCLRKDTYNDWTCKYSSSNPPPNGFEGGRCGTPRLIDGPYHNRVCGICPNCETITTGYCVKVALKKCKNAWKLIPLPTWMCICEEDGSIDVIGVRTNCHP